MESKNERCCDENALAVAVPLLCDTKKLLEHVESNIITGGGGGGIEDSGAAVGTTSFSKTCFNGLNALSGIGLLSVPYALASGGWLSLILLLLIASATFYTGLLIKRCMDMNPNIRSYPDIGDAAFGRIGGSVVSFFMNMELYLVVTGFMILEGDNLSDLFSGVGLEIRGLRIEGQQAFVVLMALVVLPSMYMNMGWMSYVSASGVLATLLILGSILWVGAFEGVGFKEQGSALNWGGIPTAVSLYSFCYSAHPVFPTLYSSMKKKHQFSQVLFLCFLLCTICYAAMAVLGYLMFGSNVQSQITLNLPTSKLSSRVAIYAALANPITKYALTAIPVVRVIERCLPSNRKKNPFSILIRTAFVISTVIVAVTVPFFGHLMSLVGAFLSCTASILLPCVCYLKISGTYRRFGFEVVVISGIMVMGVSIIIMGTCTSVVKILGHF